MINRKILIADSAEEFCNALGAELEDEFHICTTTDGYQMHSILQDFRPDLVVLDMTLPGLSNCGMLYETVRQGNGPAVLAMIRSRDDCTDEKMRRLQVQYALLKPCDVEVVAERAREIVQEQKSFMIHMHISRTRIAGVLLELGFNTKHSGYRYLCDAIELYAGNSRQGLTKELYKTVGAFYNASGGQVERSMRFALESAWKNRDDRQWAQWFPAGVIRSLKRPSNGVVITRLAECLRLEQARRFG